MTPLPKSVVRRRRIKGDANPMHGSTVITHYNCDAAVIDPGVWVERKHEFCVSFEGVTNSYVQPTREAKIGPAV